MHIRLGLVCPQPAKLEGHKISAVETNFHALSDQTIFNQMGTHRQALLMSIIKMIPITLMGLFLLGCTAGNSGRVLADKRCGVDSFWSNIYFRCLKVKGEVIKRETMNVSKKDKKCGIACQSRKDQMERGRRSALKHGRRIDDHWHDRNTGSLRLRHMNGTTTFENAKAVNNSMAIILNRWGLGVTNEQTQETYPDSTLVEMNNQYLDFSYTFNLSKTTGDSLTLTLGAGIPSGEMKVTTITNTEYRSTTASGGGYFAVLGIELWIFELLAGYRVSSVEFSEFESSSSSPLDETYKVSGRHSMIGLGLKF
jgi:hypothetical protein